ncbi:MAG: YfhO family protein [Clostridiales bacterium]|nr:YfhO family protein [Clostridiales bacterium]
MLIILASLITIIFFVLYHKPIFSGNWYAYSDTGCDTIDQYIPMTAYDVGSFWQGETDQYSLTFGLGKNNPFQWYKYLNPVNLPLLLLGTTNLRVAFIISTYLKYLLIGIFGWLFFRRLTGHDGIATICSLLWTYSGYNVLWGQHYAFLTVSVAFTLFLYGLQLILDNDKKMLFAPLAILPLAVTSYLTFYQACVFALFYGPIYLFFKRTSIREIGRAAGIFALGCILALGMGGDYVLSSVMSFFSSTRMNNVSSINISGFYSMKYIGSYFARFLSNDTMGIAWNYIGPANYYEAVMLAVSALTLFSMSWLIQTKYRRRVCCIVGCSVLCLCLPIVSHILGFRATTHRWGYLIVILEVILIGYGLREAVQSYTSGKDGDFVRKAYRAILISDSLLVAIALILLTFQKRVGYHIDKKALLIVGCSYVMYTVLLLACVFIIRNGRPKIRPVLVFAGLLACCSVELVVLNYRSINSRPMITSQQWNEGMYNDGTREAVAYIHSSDSGLYRINKTYDSVYYDDQLIQDYYGMGVYYSLNTGELVDTYITLGNKLRESTDTLTGTNYIRFPGADIVGNTTLSAKYVISKDGEELDSVYYYKIADVGDIAVYQNRFWNGFGNLYDQVMDAESFERSENREQILSAVLVTDEEKLLSDFTSADKERFPRTVEEGLSGLDMNGKVQLTEGKNRIFGTVSNQMEHPGVLCVPLLNDNHWEVTIDGKKEESYRVDGGLIGAVIPPGEHQIELVYKNNTTLIGKGISAAFVAGYGVVLFSLRKRKEHE